MKFLIYKLRTLEGQKGTAEKILKVMNRESVKEYKLLYKRDYISESARLRIIQKNEHMVFSKTYLKYLIMRVRSKISFMALI